MQILVLEHEHKLANSIKEGLRLESYRADISYDSAKGMELLANNDYDLIILDRQLPGKPDGLGVLHKLRREKIHTPILLITPKNKIISGSDQVAIDDFLVRPFSVAELLARARNLLSRPEQPAKNVLKYDDLSLDPDGFLVERAGTRIILTSKEFMLLEYLMRNADKTLAKENIIKHVWSYDASIRPNTLEVYIGYLRSKIDEPFSKPPLIGTRRGFGYYLGKLQ